MGNALYAVYLVGALGVGGIAFSLLTSNQAVNEKVAQCARMSGAEQHRCFSQARAVAEANAAMARELMPELSREVQSALK